MALKRHSQLYKIRVLCVFSRAAAAETRTELEQSARQKSHGKNKAKTEGLTSFGKIRAKVAPLACAEPLHQLPWELPARRAQRKAWIRSSDLTEIRATKKALDHEIKSLGTHLTQPSLFRACAAGARGHKGCVGVITATVAVFMVPQLL